MATTNTIDCVLDLLDERDPIEVLRKTPLLLHAIVQRETPDALRTRPFEGKWTPLEILGHLYDHEIVSAMRIRTVRFEHEPPFPPYEQEVWVSTQNQNEADPVVFAQRFEFLRAINVEQYSSLTPAELDRVGISEIRGPVPLSLLMRIHAGHDLTHLDQINRYLGATEAKSFRSTV